MTEVSTQRAYRGEALELNREAVAALRPLHEDLSTLSPSFDGIVYFAVDKWHKDNASAVATVQPESDDSERFAFYKDKIKHRRVDLGATALGAGLLSASPTYLPSRMNPTKHMTWTQRTIVDERLAGGLQVAFNTDYGTPPSEAAVERIWKHYAPVVNDVAADFEAFSKKVTSIGDTLELLAPATPNAYVISWDLRSSSALALGENYGALRNYLLDAKASFHRVAAPYTQEFHDTGDGQDMLIRLPEIVDRAETISVGQFGTDHILPLARAILRQHDNLVGDYPDLRPAISVVVGLGYVERDKYDGLTSAEYWNVSTEHKKHPEAAIVLTDSAREVLDDISTN